MNSLISFGQPNLQGKLIKRYKRFFADVELDGQIVTAHVPNTGSLKTALFPGETCFISPAHDPERKLRFTLEAVSNPDGVIIGVNTQWPNKIVYKLWNQKQIPHWENFDQCHPEFKITKETRFDFKMSNSHSGKEHFVEVKNVTYLNSSGQAQFPDAVTDRGQKHLKELMRLKSEGHSAEVVFIIQRNDASSFGPCDDIDPEYGRLLRVAQKSGVLITPLKFEITSSGIQFKEILNLFFN